MKETTGKVVKQRGIKMLFPALAMMLGILLSIGVGASASAAKKVWVQTSGTEYSYLDGKWVKSCESKTTYDKKGRGTVYEYKYFDGIMTLIAANGKEYFDIKSHKNVYTFNKKNRIKQNIEYVNGKKIGSTTYKYDSKGNIKKSVYKSKGSKNVTTTYKYVYKKKVIVKKTEKYSSGNSRIEEYTNKGVLKKSTFKSSGYSDTYTYDSKGRIVKNETKYGNTLSTTIYEYEKTSDGKIKQWATTTSDSGSSVPRHLVSEEKTDKNGNVTERINYYQWENTDEKGNVVTETVPSSKYVYKYKRVPKYTVK